MRRVTGIAGVTLLLTLTSCLTVNVFVEFPEEQVRRAAQEIEGEVGGAAAETPSEPAEGSSSVWPRLPGIRFAFGATQAWAQGSVNIDLKKSSPELKRLIASRVKRATDVYELLGRGVVAEGSDGTLVYKSGFEKMPPPVQEPVKKIAEAENLDRRGIYKEIARLNDIDQEMIGKVGEIFAEQRRLYLKPGMFFADKKGQWVEVTERMYRDSLKQRGVEAGKDGDEKILNQGG